MLKGIHRDGNCNLIFSDRSQRPTADFFYSVEATDCTNTPQYQLILFSKPASYRKVPISIDDKSDFLEDISPENATWLSDSITKVAVDATNKKKQMWKILRGNPFQPTLTNPHRYACFYMASAYELGSETSPEGAAPSALWIIFFHGLGLSTALFFVAVIIWVIVWDLTFPLTIYIHNIKPHHVISSEEEKWFQSVFDDPENAHLCAKNVEIEILSQLNEIAAELTRRTGKPCHAGMGTYSFSVSTTNSDGTGGGSYSVTRDSFEIASSLGNTQLVDKYDV